MDWRIDLKSKKSRQWEGIYLSPLHPKVNLYLRDVFKELIDNYDIDGIHLDYIRFHDNFYGYNPVGRNEFEKEYEIDPIDIVRGIISTRYGWPQEYVDSMKLAWDTYRQDKVTELVSLVNEDIQNSTKNIQLSAAVKPNLVVAKERWFQNWKDWIDKGIIDFVVPMNYFPEIKDFNLSIQIIKNNFSDIGLNKIYMGISTYNQDSQAAADKVLISRLNGFNAVSIFSYDSQKNNLEWFNPVLDSFGTNLDEKQGNKYMSLSRIVKSPTGSKLTCKGWQQEAAYRMLQNNLDPNNAEDPENLIVYGGLGKAARNWDCFDAILKSLVELENNETLLIQSGKPVAVFKTHESSPRVLISNSMIVPKWASWEKFRELDKKGLMMYGQMTAGSWIYIGTQGILQGTYETLAEVARQNFNGTLKGTITLTGGLGGMGGAQPLAVTMNEGVNITVEIDPHRIQRRIDTGYIDMKTNSLDEAISLAFDAKESGQPLSIGLLGNCAEIYPEILNRGIIPDIVTDQTSAHDELTGYIPNGLSYMDAKSSEKIIQMNILRSPMNLWLYIVRL